MKINFEEILEKVKKNNGKLIKLCGKSCTGKTAVSVKLVEYFSYELNIPTLFFSLDMIKELVENKIENSSDNLIIIDIPCIDINNICNKIEQLYDERKIKFVVIDYIQLVSYNEKENLPFDEQQYNIISRLNNIAKNFNITIFITQNLNSRDNKIENYHIEIL
jgi:replicative DNA helicase